MSYDNFQKIIFDLIHEMNKTKLILIFVLLIALGFLGNYLKKKFADPGRHLDAANIEVNHLIEGNEIKEGDIIFQISLSKQSRAIQLVTHSKYSHCGIISKINNEYFVFEAAQPVKFTPVSKWIARGEDGHYVIKRLKNSDQILQTKTITVFKDLQNKFKRKGYDVYFGWSDERIYCSELIWKIYYQATGLEVGKLQHLKDLDLSSEEVKKIMVERYGDSIPLEETVISPSSIFDSDLLQTVKTN